MLYLNCVHLNIRAFYFFADPCRPHMEGLTELYSVACTVVDNATTLDHSGNLALSCTMYIHRMIMLAALSILKISRSILAPYLDLKWGERSYFSAILFSRRMSLENDDLSARSAEILRQLWTSQKIFRRADGTVNSLPLRIRSRFAMSVVFDCFWWWRAEFAGQPNPFPDAEDTSAQGGNSKPFGQHFSFSY